MAARTEHRGLIWAVGIAGVLAALLLLAVILAGRPTDGVLTGTAVEGVDVGGMDQETLRETVAEVAQVRSRQPVEVVAELDRQSADRETVGELVDTRATVAEAWNRGRGLVAGLPARLRARFGATTDLSLETRLDEQTARQWARRTAEALSAPSQEGDVALVADPAPRVEVTEPATGEVVDGEDLGDRLVEAMGAQRAAVVLDAPSTTTEPAVGSADVAAVRPLAERAISASVELVNPTEGEDVGLSPAQLAELLAVVRDEDAPEGQRLRIVAEADALPAVVGVETIAAADAEPVEATFIAEGGTVTIEGGTSGFTLDVPATAERIRDLAIGEGPRTGELPGQVIEPDRTREAAEALGIEQQVATFTTSYPCCPSRVTNIRRMAELVNGALILPGASFSLNDHVGERTEAQGFVPGGVIQDGRFEEAVGGGISQFATTFFNTAFFAGIELVRFQPHSFYIERYPMGRESTISFGAIDVVVTNDSPHGILVAAAASDTNVTVTFLSTPWAEVDEFTSEPYDVVEGDLRDGFTVDFGRTVTYPDGSTSTAEYTHTYRPEFDEADEGNEDDQTEEAETEEAEAEEAEAEAEAEAEDALPEPIDGDG